MAVPYTLGIWRVKPGRADEFVAAWTEFADWTTRHARGAGWGRLLRDVNDDHRFVGVGRGKASTRSTRGALSTRGAPATRACAS